MNGGGREERGGRKREKLGDVPEGREGGRERERERERERQKQREKLVNVLEDPLTDLRRSRCKR